MSKGAIEQALEAFIAEAKRAGLDVEKVSKAAATGIMGNDIYSWITTLEKTKAVSALEDAVAEISKIDV